MAQFDPEGDYDDDQEDPDDVLACGHTEPEHDAHPPGCACLADPNECSLDLDHVRAVLNVLNG